MTKHEHLIPLAYSVKGASQITTLGRTRIYQLISEGRLKVIRVGGRTLIPAASLHALISGED